MSVYFTSDWHLFHRNIMRYEPSRPPDWATIVMQDWCDRVTPEDRVYFLGDLALGTKEERREALELLASLPGQKHWCLGNHDGYTLSAIEDHGIAAYPLWCVPEPQVLAAHYPLETHDSRRAKEVAKLNDLWRKGGFKMHVHGHSHSKRPHRYGPDDRFVNVSIEVTNFRLVCLDDLLRR